MQNQHISVTNDVTLHNAELRFYHHRKDTSMSKYQTHFHKNNSTEMQISTTLMAENC